MATTREEIEAMLPIRMISKVVRGYGRGSKELGIPTANLDRDASYFRTSVPFDALPTGIYWGLARIVDDNDDNDNNHSGGLVYKTAISIGYNPTYGNTIKTIEPHLIADPHDERRFRSQCHETILHDFYDQTIRLVVVGYLRPELPFEGLEKLTEAIKKDILKTEEIAESAANLSDVCKQERCWVSSGEGI
jgi:riboflavin kinase